MTKAIETFNLTKNFPLIKKYRDIILHPFTNKEFTALRNVNLEVKRGELFGLLGPNGAGKTTLIKILCTLVLPTSGRAFVNGFEVTKDDEKIKKTIGYIVSDERSFYWRLTGRQNLMFFATLNNIPSYEEKERINRLLDFVGLTKEADKMFKDYSTGGKQKLSIARGLLTSPDVIFMDEPTRGLDPLSVQTLRELIKRLINEEKKTIVLATHNLHEAEELCDRIAIINRGEVQNVCTVKDVKKGFHMNKIYIIHLENAGNDLIERIRDITPVRDVIPLSKGSSSRDIQIHIKITDGIESATEVIEKIIEIGGRISFFSEKETSLEEHFSEVVKIKEQENQR